MALVGAECLSDLESLDRRFLHMFVTGPGEGEAIAVALPRAGWIFVDGCRTTNRGPEKFPIEELYKKYRLNDDPVELMVLSHPHRDHMYGFDELLEEYRPLRIGILGTENPRRTLADEAAALRQRIAKEDRGQTSPYARAHTVLSGIERATEAGSELLGLYDGVDAYLSGRISVAARAPDSQIYQDFIRSNGVEPLMGRRANEFSLVLELTYDKTQLVLGGDLVRSTGAGSCPSGWDKVMREHPELGYHVGLKIPHHCSRQAIHPDLMGPFDADRAWCATPYNSSSIPNSESGEGLEEALRGQSPIMLTALPVSRENQQPAPQGMRNLADMRSIVAQLKGRTFNPADQIHRANSRLDPLDPIWAVAFDDGGNIRGRWRGKVAFDVTSE